MQSRRQVFIYLQQKQSNPSHLNDYKFIEKVEALWLCLHQNKQMRCHMLKY